MMIIRFKDRKEYDEWLRWESWDTREKAKRFTEKYGDILPIVIQVDGFTPQGGEWAPAYVFLHPQAGQLLQWAVVD